MSDIANQDPDMPPEGANVRCGDTAADNQRLAFDAAIQIYGNVDTPDSPEEIVDAAQLFADFLNGVRRPVNTAAE